MPDRHLFRRFLIAGTWWPYRAGGNAQRGRGEPQPPVRAHSNDVDTTSARLPLASADQKYAALDGARMKQTVNDITAISRKSRDEGVKYWGRIAGTKADKEMEEYAGATLPRDRSAGRAHAVRSTCRRSGSPSTGK